MTMAGQRHLLALAATSYPGADPIAFIEAAARANFDGVGLRLYLTPGQNRPFVPVVGNAALIRDVKAALDRTGLDFLDVFSFYLEPELNLDRMLPAFEVGADLGARYVLVLANDPDFQRMADNLGKVAAGAACFGLTVALEAPHTRIEVKTLPRALELVAASGAENVVLVIDTNQFALAGHDLALLRQQDPRLFPYGQLTDARPDQGGACGPGEGSAPIGEILAALPPGLPLSVEWSPPAGALHDVNTWAEIAYRTSVACLTP